MIDVKEDLFKARTANDNTYMLAAHLPIGKAWSAAFNPESNFGKIVIGLAVEYYRLGVLTEEIAIEGDIQQTSQLLEQWEKSVGIPNACFPQGGTIAERRRNIEALFSNFKGVQTEEDFIRVAEEFGYTVTIITGVEAGTFPLVYPIVFFSTTKSAKFTIVVTTNLGSSDEFFPLGFPLPFSAGGTTLLRCIFELLVPANVQIIFIND